MKDSAREIMSEFGFQRCLHFIDLNKDEQAFNLQYANDIKRREDIQRLLNVIQAQQEKYRVSNPQPESIEEFEDSLEIIARAYNKPESIIFEDVENEIKDKSKFIQDQIARLGEMESSLSYI